METTTKSVKDRSNSFLLNKRGTNHKRNLKCEGTILRHISNPKYFSVTLDPTLTFKKHLRNTAAKVKTPKNIIQQLANTMSMADFMRAKTLSFLYSIAQYYVPILLNSHYTNVLDSQLNQTIKSTPTQWLPVLCNNAPARARCLLYLVTKIQQNR